MTEVIALNADSTAREARVCCICMGSVEPFDVSVSVKCRNCYSPFHAQCIKSWDKLLEDKYGDDAECKTCGISEPVLTSKSDYALQKKFMSSIQEDLCADVMEACNEFTLECVEQIECTKTAEYLKVKVQKASDSLHPRVEECYMEKFTSKMSTHTMPDERQQTGYKGLVKKFLKIELKVFKKKMYSSVRKTMLKLREKRIQKLVKALGLELREKFLKSRFYQCVVETEFESYKDVQKKWESLGVQIDIRNHLETQCSLFSKRIAHDPLMVRLYETVSAYEFDDPVLQTAIEKYCFNYNYEKDEEGDSSLMWIILERDLTARFKEYNEKR